MLLASLIAVLSDNSVVDVWGKGDVSYELPGAGAASTSTPRRGRWRSFPYLKEMDSEFEKRALWNYLCRQVRHLHLSEERKNTRAEERSDDVFVIFQLVAPATS